MRRIFLMSKAMENMTEYFYAAIKRTRREINRLFGNQFRNHYRGYCDVACDILAENIQSAEGDGWKVLETKPVHGELAHKPTIPSSCWYMEHTLLKVTVVCDNCIWTIYLDATCEQFQKYVQKIPDTYIGLKAPSWLYMDTANPRFANDNPLHNKIYSFLQFYVWAYVSDTIGLMMETLQHIWKEILASD